MYLVLQRQKDKPGTDVILDVLDNVTEEERNIIVDNIKAIVTEQRGDSVELCCVEMAGSLTDLVASSKFKYILLEPINKARIDANLFPWIIDTSQVTYNRLADELISRISTIRYKVNSIIASGYLDRVFANYPDFINGFEGWYQAFVQLLTMLTLEELTAEQVAIMSSEAQGYQNSIDTIIQNWAYVEQQKENRRFAKLKELTAKLGDFEQHEGVPVQLSDNYYWFNKVLNKFGLVRTVDGDEPVIEYYLNAYDLALAIYGEAELDKPLEHELPEIDPPQPVAESDAEVEEVVPADKAFEEKAYTILKESFGYTDEDLKRVEFVFTHLDASQDHLDFHLLYTKDGTLYEASTVDSRLFEECTYVDKLDFLYKADAAGRFAKPYHERLMKAVEAYKLANPESITDDVNSLNRGETSTHVVLDESPFQPEDLKGIMEVGQTMADMAAVNDLTESNI